MKGEVVFSGYSAFYKLKRKKFLVALDNISLKIDGGSSVAIVGESGSGKTTFLKAIAGFCDYSEGEVYIDGRSADARGKNTNVAYVSQQYSLYSHLTVFENIAFPLRVKKMPQIEIVNAVKKVAKDLDIDLLLTRKPFQLSVGQQQKVAIARAVVKDPDVLLLDEPFSNQDMVSGEDARKILNKVRENCSATLILVSHDVNDARSLADKAVILEEGAVKSYGDACEVLEGYGGSEFLSMDMIKGAADEKTEDVARENADGEDVASEDDVQSRRGER